MHAAARYTEVAVTLPVAGRFHYRVPTELASRAKVGARVLVRFGSRKVTGVVVREESPLPDGITAIDLSEVLDGDVPALPTEVVDLCLWVADYYEAPPGEVMRAALPAGSGVAAKRVWVLTEAGQRVADGEGSAMPAKEQALLARIAESPLPAAGQNEGVKRTLLALHERGLVDAVERRAAGRVRLKRERIAQLVNQG